MSVVASSRNRQLEIPLPDKNGQRRGGKRPGAGRKPKGPRAGVTHARRVELDPSKPLHITLRVVAAVAALRTAKANRAIRAGLYRGRIDPFSSGAQFYGWSTARWRTSIYPRGYERVAIAAPLTWMLGVGYLRGRRAPRKR